MSLLLAPVAALVGAPGLLIWLPGVVIGAPLAILAALALSLLPGLALLQVLAPGRLAPAERFAAALGLSWAVPPLLLLLAEQLGLAWNAALCWLCLGACAAILLWQHLKRPVPRLSVRPDSELITLMALTALGLVVRLYAIRDLPAGLFGDSYHHTVIVQLLIDKQGLFRSWSPYAPLTTFTYHYGFHSFAAWFSWLSGVPAMASVVVVGQIAGGLAVPGVFLLTRRLIPDPRVALSSALLVALVSVFPAFYVNWGRYTQLAGQTILPVTCLAWFLLLDTATTPGARWRALVRPGGLAALATAGVILGHYRVALLSAILVLLYGLYALAVRVRSWHA
ncbi:MAG: hypothetical protein N2378_01300, partial [Chloroflexaceae bacterium]|nr:hypothetical protein [Chloroflexaceae bacterium]